MTAKLQMITSALCKLAAFCGAGAINAYGAYDARTDLTTLPPTPQTTPNDQAKKGAAKHSVLAAPHR